MAPKLLSTQNIEVAPPTEKSFELDADKITRKKAARFLKAIQATEQLTDIEEKMDAEAAALAAIIDNWTAEELQDLPTYKFNQLITQLVDLIKGQQIPN